MAYKSNIPQPTQQISQSQSDILNNFTEINTFVNVDHVGFGAADAGKHAKTTFPQSVAPAAVGASEVGVYCADLNGNPELFINKTASQIPFTAALKATPGWTILPSGIIMKWGSAFVAHGASAPINFAVDPSGNATFTVAPTVMLSELFPGGGTEHPIMLSAVTATSVTVYNISNNGTTVYYLAIGY